MGDRLSKIISESMTKVFVEPLLALPRVAYYTEQIFFPQVFNVQPLFVCLFFSQERKRDSSRDSRLFVTVCLSLDNNCLPAPCLL